ncbi:response regulator [Planctomycetes bacterium K23_9]|uniref:Response regulator MprA n=1 Tax=Stieleria marina TaxID=1930275 RepID=A0A517NXU7_9BACT|nr:Response regulator MprA [Planctomycetes bacterium K23_9]
MHPANDTKNRPAPFPARVLVVDDDRANRILLRTVLRVQGSQVVVAADGLEAWGKLSDGGFDALVTDYEMPRWSGLELLEAVRRSKDPAIAGIPAIVISSVETSNFSKRIGAMSRTFFLPKPVDACRLTVMLELIGSHRNHLGDKLCE